jgi:hypothetical protein
MAAANAGSGGYPPPGGQPGGQPGYVRCCEVFDDKLSLT